MPSKVLYFIRHGEADYNLLDRVNAHPEIPNNLTVKGREQAAYAAAQLAGEGIEAMYCSMFPRARQTAEVINVSIAVPLHVDPRLNETGAFAFEGQPAAAWHLAQVPDRLRAQVVGCEPFDTLKVRLVDFLGGLRTSAYDRIAVVSHEEPIQIMVGILQGIPDAQAKARSISHGVPIRMSMDVGDTAARGLLFDPG